MKKWVQIIPCVVLSAGIWLIHNLSQSYVSIVSVPMIAVSNIDGRADTSLGEEIITAQVKASGLKQMALFLRRNRPRKVEIDASDFRFEGSNIYSLPSALLLKYAKDIFAEEVNIESIISPDPKFTFALISHKKVPVKNLNNLSFRSQFMAVSPMTFSPDSVTVYGEPSRIVHVESIRTKPITISDINANLHGKVKLDIPIGLRLSDQEVIYSMDVARYVELEREFKISVRNVPPQMQLSVLPSSVKVVFNCVFPVISDPKDEAEFYIDYNDFADSINGRCIVRADKIPEGVIDYKIYPEVLDCLLRSLEL